jgi:hypothetical protein
MTIEGMSPDESALVESLASTASDPGRGDSPHSSLRSRLGLRRRPFALSYTIRSMLTDLELRFPERLG